MNKERRRNIGFKIFITVACLFIAGVLVYAGYATAEARAAVEYCSAQGTIAVQKALSGYVCVEEAR